MHDTPRTLIDELLSEQRRLTPVERFAQRHERGEVAQARYYRDLLPTAMPRAGQQYAFAVDLDACTGCKACVSACHSLNGLEEDEIWRNVGVLYGGEATAPYQQTVTTACHHCLEPACLEGCPVMAYDKDAVTGIVRHLDDQCIGCQYCVLKCPYDVPKYSAKRGIVRKCDMCSSRLAVGEAPACVQACPTQAIRIDVIEVEKFERDLRPGEVLVPGAFDSTYTKPTTRYRTTRTMPENARPGDVHTVRLEDAHWPLVLMLVFTQMGVGMFAVLALLAPGGGPPPLLGLSAFVALQSGLGVSVLHLGRPLGAWRFFLGLRTSWMSREILAFGLLALLGAATTAAAWSQPLRGGVAPLAGLTTLVGICAICCSAMIYIDTRRAFWRTGRTLGSFFSTTALLGASGAACLGGDARVWSLVAMAILIVTFAAEAAWFFAALRDVGNVDHRPARTMWKLRRGWVLSMPVLFLISIAALCTGIAMVGYATAVASRVIERYFFFTAVTAPRMPGAITS